MPSGGAWAEDARDKRKATSKRRPTAAVTILFFVPLLRRIWQMSREEKPPPGEPLEGIF